MQKREILWECRADRKLYCGPSRSLLESIHSGYKSGRRDMVQAAVAVRASSSPKERVLAAKSLGPRTAMVATWMAKAKYTVDSKYTGKPVVMMSRQREMAGLCLVVWRSDRIRAERQSEGPSVAARK